MSPRSSRRRPALVLALLALVAAACSGGSDAPRARNVLLITLDTTRADRLGCYGYGRARTPYVDRLASQAVRFERAGASAAMTPMSHASILTGLNNYGHGVRVFHGDGAGRRLRPSVAYLPELLRDRGWTTAARVSAYPVTEIYGLERGFDDFESGVDTDRIDLDKLLGKSTAWFEGRHNLTQRRGDATVGSALRWLDERRAGEPWFLWVHLFDVHDLTLVPPQEFAATFGVVYDKSASAFDHEWLERMYDVELSFMDAQVGRLLDGLAQRGAADDTVVVLTADHGQGLTDGEERHGWFLHRLVYEEALRVPLLLRAPGLEPGVVTSQVRTIDILPTVLELLGLDVPPVEGESLLALLDEEAPADRIVYADALNLVDERSAVNRLPQHARDNLFSVADGRWKLIHHERRPEESELYDLARDPLELENVAAEHPEVLARLRAFLDETGAMELEHPEDVAGPAADLEALEALGYTGDGDGG